MTERLQKILSQWGIASRREAEKMILEGKVKVNGKIAQLGDKANPVQDKVEVEGKRIKISHRPQLIYLLLHKPRGVICTCSDPKNRKTVLDILPKQMRSGLGLHPVGRLDVDSSGALLLTNDGDLTLTLTHPRYHLSKTYHVWVEGTPTESVLAKWQSGVMLEGRKTLPAKITVLKHHQHKTLLQIILTEGRNRQIRRLAEQLGYPVLQLHRTAIGIIQLDLPTGEYRPLTNTELKFLQYPQNKAKNQAKNKENDHKPRSNA